MEEVVLEGLYVNLTEDSLLTMRLNYDYHHKNIKSFFFKSYDFQLI